ncbi:MAG: sodium-dependent transporter [Lachnospirales bacterium]
MRDTWSSRSGFLLSAIGAAIGLGNLWRFPFQAYKNGGGAFFFPYFIALITCAIPLMIMEYSYGRLLRGGSIKAFAKLNKKFEVIGWVQVMVPVVVMMFYSAIISISFIFMIGSLSYAFGNTSFLDMTNPGEFMTMVTGSANNAFDFKSGISLYMLCAVVIVWIFNCTIVKNGISSGIEKVSKIFIPLLMILIIAFMVKAITLDGAALGLNALFEPDFSKILDPKVWISAYSQVFFSTTLAVGVMIAYGSYLKDNDDIINNSLITVFSNASFDIIAGITVFSTLGFLVQSQGVDFESFGTGAGVAFIAFPIAISTMSSSVFVQGILGFLFFLCMFIAGISSSISMVEAFSTAVLDKFNIDRKRLVKIVSIVGFVGSALFSTYAGFNIILDIVDSYVANYIIATLGLVEVIAISYIFKTEKLRDEANRSSDFKIGIWWDILLKVVTPILLGVTVVLNFITATASVTKMSGADFWANIVFGYGVLVLMIGVSIIFYKKPWKKEL